MTTPYIQTDENTILVLRHPRSVLPSNFNRGPSETLDAYAKYLESVGAGMQSGDAWVDIHRGSTNAKPVNAMGRLVFASSSGTVGGTINGVAVTAAFATSDANTAGLVSAAIRASVNVLVKGMVSASSLGVLVTLTTPVAGNTITLRPTGSNGVTFTAVTGKPAARGEFVVGGSDTVCATNLKAAIDATPAFQGRLAVFTSAGVLTIIQLEPSAVSRFRVEKVGTPIALTLVGAANQFVNQATLVVWCTQKGLLGNAVTLVASGTGVTAPDGGGARLAGGVGGDLLPVSLVR